ncbi:plastocyanin [Candidatus Parcubacteria bacterium]|nr:MAG: plastocyanin [Candidatus Parcubacteria bacterium]
MSDISDEKIKDLKRDVDINEPPDEAGYISIVGFNFTPEILNVAVGTEVVWSNDDSNNHQIESDSNKVNYKSDLLYPGENFTYVFNDSGEYSYHCSIHSEEKGKVVVEDYYY